MVTTKRGKTSIINCPTQGKLTRHAVFRAFENELIFMFGEIIYQYFRLLSVVDRVSSACRTEIYLSHPRRQPLIAYIIPCHKLLRAKDEDLRRMQPRAAKG